MVQQMDGYMIRSLLVIVSISMLSGCSDNGEDKDTDDPLDKETTDSENERKSEEDANTDTLANREAETDVTNDTAFDSNLESDENSVDLDFGVITPPDGAIVTLDYNPLDVIAWAPQTSIDGRTDFEALITISANRRGKTVSIVSGVVGPGEYVAGSFDLEGLSEGDKIEFEFTIECPGASDAMGLDRTVTFSEVKKPVFVSDCTIHAAHLGAALDIRCNALSPKGTQSLTHWSLAGGPEKAAMNDGLISSSGTLSSADLGTHYLTIKTSDGVVESDTYSVTAMVDEHLSELSFNAPILSTPPMDWSFRKLLPESIADNLATACNPKFDPTLKPDNAKEDPYEISLAGSCAFAFLQNLESEQSETLSHYAQWLGDDLVDKGGEDYSISLESTESVQIRFTSLK